jgi:S1/P1 Nuclease
MKRGLEHKLESKQQPNGSPFPYRTYEITRTILPHTDRTNSTMHAPLATLLSLSALAQLGSCWGSLGHRTVAYVAQKNLSPGAAAYVSQILGGEDISDAALWADQIKRQRPKTAPWHFIDAMDDPPRNCCVKYKRDCVPKDGCVVSAIVDMVSLRPRLRCAWLVR